MSKAALEMMVKTWAHELDQTRVIASVLDPGPVATKLRRIAFPSENPATQRQPDEVASLFADRVLAG